MNVFSPVLTYYPSVETPTHILGKWNSFQNYVSSYVDPISKHFLDNSHLTPSGLEKRPQMAIIEYV